MRTDKKTIVSFGIPIFLFVVAFGWKLVFISRGDICIDEPFTIFHAQESIKEILFSTTSAGPNAPLFIILLHFWIKIFGISAYSVRLLPLLFNALTAVYLYLIGKKFYNVQSGLLASSLFILATYHFHFATEARSYSMLSMGTVCSLYYFLSIIKKPEYKISFIGLIVSDIILTYSHFFGWFVVFIQFAISFLYIKEKKVFKTILLALLIAGVIFLPMVPIFIKQFFASSKGTWVLPPANNEYLNQLYFFLNSKAIFNTVSTALLFGLIYLILSGRIKLITKEIIVILLWWIVPYTVMFIVSAKIPMFIDRYVLFNSIGLYVFISIFVNLIYKEILGYLIGFVLIIMMFYYLEINSKQLFYREVQNAVDNVKKEENRNSIIIIHPHWADLGFMYYYNNDIFKNTKEYNSLLMQNNIFPVWNIDEAKDYIKIHKNKRIILYQDGSMDYNAIFQYLDSTYVRVDSSFYPQCIMVGVFDPK